MCDTMNARAYFNTTFVTMSVSPPQQQQQQQRRRQSFIFQFDEENKENIRAVNSIALPTQQQPLLSLSSSLSSSSATTTLTTTDSTLESQIQSLGSTQSPPPPSSPSSSSRRKNSEFRSYLYSICEAESENIVVGGATSVYGSMRSPPQDELVFKLGAQQWDHLSRADFMMLYSNHGALLGSGVYGSVYLVEDKLKDSYIALKIMHRYSPDNASVFDEEETARQEVQALRILKHTYGEEFCRGRFPILHDYFVVAQQFSAAASDSIYALDFLDVNYVTNMFRRNNGAAYLWCFSMAYEHGYALNVYVYNRLAQQQKANVRAWRSNKSVAAAARAWHSYRAKSTARFVDSISLARTLQQVLAALSYVHEAHLVHGDLTTNNVRMRRDGTPIILDFGFALSTQQQQQQQQPHGNWSGERLPPLPIHHAADRVLAYGYSERMKHALVADILRATDVAQVAESFAYMSKKANQMYATRSMHWTPTVKAVLESLINLDAVSFAAKRRRSGDNDGDCSTHFFATRLQRAIDRDEALMAAAASHYCQKK